MLFEVDDGDLTGKGVSGLVDAPNDVLGGLVVGVGLAGVYELDASGLVGDALEVIEVAEDEVGALVGGGAASKADGHDAWSPA